MTPTDSGPIAVLRLMIQQNDEKHEAAHKRLRVDLRQTETDVGHLEERRAQDHEMIMQWRERRKQTAELTQARAVIVAALVGAATGGLFVVVAAWIQHLGK